MLMNVLQTLLQQTTQPTHGGEPVRGNPRQLLRKILGYLDFTTLRHICGVNRICRDIGCDPFLWASFNQWLEMPADDTRLARVLTQPRFSHLSTLKLDKPETDVNIILEKLFPPDSTLIQSLRSLDLAYSAATPCPYLTDIGMSFIARAVHLTLLNINRLNKITDAGLAQIANLTELNSLNISHLYEVSDNGIASLNRLRNLQYLNMGHCPRVSDVGLQTLSNFVDLQYLNLEWCIKVGSSGLPFLPRMTKLQSLNVTMCMHVNDQCLHTISTITSIQYLNLSDCHNITLQGVNSISRLPRLQFINLSRCPLNDQYLPYPIKSMLCLQALIGTGCLSKFHTYKF
eukprot:Phypoly_transcript_10669.p1 GENE.Phypoly_transcript_10669~~Phypoly_transcript_10669.p1  ORF type:complete len:344 (+),score=-8.57 Phypoly_transcript_10669:154-1185(+)